MKKTSFYGGIQAAFGFSVRILLQPPFNFVADLSNIFLMQVLFFKMINLNLMLDIFLYVFLPWHFSGNFDLTVDHQAGCQHYAGFNNLIQLFYLFYVGVYAHFLDRFGYRLVQGFTFRTTWPQDFNFQKITPFYVN